AAHYLNLDSALYESGEGAELAGLLHRSLDQRGNLIPFSFISEEVTGKLDDELQADLERVGTINDEEEAIIIYVEKIKGPDGGPVWLFSNQTISRIPRINIDASVPLVDKFLPEVLKQNK